MTDRPGTSRPPYAGWIVVGAASVFVAFVALLAWQVRTGRDPALGGVKKTSASLPPSSRPVLEKRVVRTVIITRVVQDDAAGAGGPATATSAPVVTSSSSSAPVASAPAPASAAPTPVVTRTS
jgi:hypothetical protein